MLPWQNLNHARNIHVPRDSEFSKLYKHGRHFPIYFSGKPDTKPGPKHTQSYSPSSSLAVLSWNPATAFPFPLLLLLIPFGPSPSSSSWAATP